MVTGFRVSEQPSQMLRAPWDKGSTQFPWPSTGFSLTSSKGLKACRCRGKTKHERHPGLPFPRPDLHPALGQPGSEHPLLCHQPLPEPIPLPSTLDFAAHTLLSWQVPHPALRASPRASQSPSACSALSSKHSRRALGCFAAAQCPWDLLWGGRGGALVSGLQGHHTEVQPALPLPSSAGPPAWLSPTPVTLQRARMGMFASRILLQKPSTQHIQLVWDQGSATAPPGPRQAAWLSQAEGGYHGLGMAVGI